MVVTWWIVALLCSASFLSWYSTCTCSQVINRSRCITICLYLYVSLVLRDGNWRYLKWTEVVVGDIMKVLGGQFFPADLILLSSRWVFFKMVASSNWSGQKWWKGTSWKSAGISHFQQTSYYHHQSEASILLFSFVICYYWLASDHASNICAICIVPTDKLWKIMTLSVAQSHVMISVVLLMLLVHFSVSVINWIDMILLDVM